VRLKGFDVSHRLLEDWRGVQVYLKETKLLRVCTKGTNPTELRTPTSVILHFCRNSWSAKVGVGVFQFKIFE
jgi:hypothetical protein